MHVEDVGEERDGPSVAAPDSSSVGQPSSVPEDASGTPPRDRSSPQRSRLESAVPPDGSSDAQMTAVAQSRSETGAKAGKDSGKRSSRSRSRRSRSTPSPSKADDRTAVEPPTTPEETLAHDIVPDAVAEPREPVAARQASPRRASKTRQSAEPDAQVLAAAPGNDQVVDTGAPRSARKAARQGAEPTRARIAVRKGLPEIVVSDETLPPAMLFGNVTASGASRRVHSQAVRAAANGVRLLSTLVELVCPMPPDDTVYQMLDERMELLLSVGRDVYVIPRVVFVPSPIWREQYPMEIQAYERGKGEDPSIASDHYWDEAGRSLRLLIEHARRTSYGHRVIGYHLERGEWFQPIDAGFDRCYANREGFRRWLRRKYGDNEVALRAAWFDGKAQFFTAEIPPVPQPLPAVPFFDPRRERRWIDFMEYTSDMTAERIMALAKVVKEATEGRALVSACYGYTWEFAQPWSGHLALERLLECPDIDILTGPISYAERSPGASGALPGPVDSVLLHGKLWMVEDDTKTHLARPSSSLDSFNPRMENKAATAAVHLRTIGTALAHQLGVAWMDLWGEGWLDGDEIWGTLGWFPDIATRCSKTRRRTSPEVVALLDERSLCHFNGGEGLMQKVLLSNRESLCRCGATVGVYLQSDVTHKDFPTDAKLYLFLTPYRLPEAQRAAIRDKLWGGGRTLVWFYGVGTMTDRDALEEPTPDVVGLNLRPQPWHSEIGTRIVQPGHVVVQGVPDRTLGTRMCLNPSYYVDDDSPGMVILGEYEQTGLPSLVLRNYGDGTTIFCGEPMLTPELLRGLCRYAGVHLYTRAPEDYAQAGYGWLTLHVLRDGFRTLTLPDGTIACDASERICSSSGAREYRSQVRARSTYVFYIGPQEIARKLGFEPSRTKPAPPPPTMPPPPPLPTFDPARPAEEQPEAPVSSGQITPIEEGAQTTPELVGTAVDAGSQEGTGAESEGAKRKRRRGGRGRGRRKKTSSRGSSSGGEATPASAD